MTALQTRLAILAFMTAALPLFVADGAEREGYTALEVVPQAGAIIGQVTFNGRAPEPRSWEVKRDRDVCGARKQVSSVHGIKGGLAEAVVTLRDITEGKTPGEGPTLSQQQCEFVPRVMAMTVGQRLTLVNRDPLPTLVTGLDGQGAAQFRFLQPNQNAQHKQHITAPGLIRVQGDDDRPWARALIYVAEHPYVTVTSEDGTFFMGQVPPGKHELLVWHETLGSLSQQVEVKAGGQANVSFLMGAQAP